MCMTTSIGNTPNPKSLSAVSITCPTLDVSKLSPEEREKAIERIGHVTIDGLNGGGGNGCCYPPGYYTNNWGGQTVKKRVVNFVNMQQVKL